MNLESSLEKILSSDTEFGDLFYRVFFEKHPDAKQYFQTTNMNAQSLMLAVSLRMVGDFQKRGFSAIQQYLRLLGTRHADHRVPKEMYPKWRDSFLVTLKEFHGDDWSESLGEEWGDAIDAISVVMFEGYDKRAGI